ncbi:MAG: HD-GYP domain-containing protein [Treponema sp.]
MEKSTVSLQTTAAMPFETPHKPPANTLPHDVYEDIIHLTKHHILPIFVVDTNLMIRYISDSAYKLFEGYYTLERKPLFNVLGTVFNQSGIQSFLNHIRSKEKGYMWIGDIEHKARMLRTLHTRVRVHPFFDSADALAGYWVVFEDITGQHNESYKKMLYGLLEASRLKDNDTGSHAERLNFYCKQFSEYLFSLNIYPQINQDFIENISFLAAIHDIGKIGTPDYILQKQSKLSKTEWEIMKEHTINGALIVSAYPIGMAKEIALSHHEKWDGSGYPFKLEGEMIPLAARIVAVADVYDALRMKRPYKDGLSHLETVEYILQESDKHFDPQLLQHFQKTHRVFESVWDSLQDTPHE